MIFSVIIPTRNRYNNVHRVIEALNNQTLDRSEYEIIVSDDNSNDQTFEIYKEFRDKGRIKYVNNNTKPHTWNASIPRNLGAAISDPESKAFIFIDSDVVLPGGALKFYKEDYETNPNRVIIGSYDFHLENGNKVTYPNGETGDVRSPKFKEVSPNDTFDTIHDGLACFGGNILIPKEIFWSVGGFSPDIHIGLEDGDMGLKLWKKGTQFSYDDRVRGNHQWHEPPKDRFPSDMKDHVDYLNRKHFHMNTNEVDKNMDLITATKETYASWGIDGWRPPEEWTKMGMTLRVTKL